MTVFEFVDEIPPHSGRGPKPDPLLQEFADALRQRPNTWAKYPKPCERSGTRASLAYLINAGDAKSPRPFRSGGFEAANRGQGLYVRYVGGES